MKKPEIRIDIVSDVVCPWCYIGKRRVEKAIDQLRGVYDFTITYLPFELNPDVPKEGIDQKAYLIKKFGGEERYHQITQQVTQAAKGEGLAFDFHHQHTYPNTRDAHRLIWLAKQEQIQPPVKEAFMKAYFEEGVDLSKHDNLVSIAISAGLDKVRVIALLSSQEGIAEVTASEQMNHQRGISGVPYYVINSKYGVSGAQPTEFFVRTFTTIAEKNE